MDEGRSLAPSGAGSRRLRLVVTGEPVPKGRPRMNTKTGTTYTPKTTRDYEMMVSVMALSKRTRFGKATVRLDLSIYTAKESSDGDNVLKSVCDALQMAQVFDNDNQVIEYHVYKIHSSTPRIEVDVTESARRTEDT